jgi:hypothetical protein
MDFRGSKTFSGKIPFFQCDSPVNPQSDHSSSLVLAGCGTVNTRYNTADCPSSMVGVIVRSWKTKSVQIGRNGLAQSFAGLPSTMTLSGFSSCGSAISLRNTQRTSSPFTFSDREKLVSGSRIKGATTASYPHYHICYQQLNGLIRSRLWPLFIINSLQNSTKSLRCAEFFYFF